ncbi:hypothetical protein SprV_0301163300 [Sparganum proliferum]
MFVPFLDNPRGDRPQRRTVLVVQELACYKVDIAVLSETRFSAYGQLEEEGLRCLEGTAESSRNRRLKQRWPSLPATLRRTPPPDDQHLLPPANEEQGHLDAPSIAALAAAGLSSVAAERSAGRAGDRRDLRRRWLDGPLLLHLQDEAPSASPQETTNLMFSVTLMDAYRDERPPPPPGIRISHRTDRHLLNSRRMQGPTRPSTTTVRDLLLEDDCELNTTTEVDMQQSMDLLSAG